MKAKTEINGIELRYALKAHTDLLDQKRIEKRAPKLVTKAPEVSAPALPETTTPDAMLPETSEVLATEPTIPEAVVSAAPAVELPTPPTTDTVVPNSNAPVNVEQRLAEMKAQKEEAFKKQQEAKAELLEEVKIPFVAHLVEHFKWSDEKAALAIDALEVIDTRRLAQLRKVRILTLDKESEKIPARDAKKIGDLLFIADYLAPLVQPSREDDDRKSRGNKRFKKGDDKNKPRSFDKKPSSFDRNDRKPAGPENRAPNQVKPAKTFVPRTTRVPVEKVLPSGVGPKPVFSTAKQDTQEPTS